jgi:hypothetical protein
LVEELFMESHMRLLIIGITLITLTACGAASRDSEPNALQRATILSKNKAGITIEHSTWGKPIAFRYADEHCESHGKLAIYRGATGQTGPDIISSWQCVNE